MTYDPGMHYPLLSTREGVSLERTNPEVPSGRRDNWHSAAETAGFATPAGLNSHTSPSEATDQQITTFPPVFSPDNDGRDDLLNIIIREDQPDMAASIGIYDSKGRMINQLVNNVLLGTDETFTWDGMTADRTKAPIGFYILLIELTRTDGTVKRFKRTVVLGAKL